MVSFDYVVSLSLAGRRCVVLGGGPLAVDRVEGLLAVGARTEIYAAEPSARLTELDGELPDGERSDGQLPDSGSSDRGSSDRAASLQIHRRTYRRGDLAGAFLAVATREDDADIELAWDEAESRGVLFAALDDVPHCHFAAPARVRRGDLSVTVSTAGKAPALSKRLRQRLEGEVDEAYGELVEVLHEAREAALPRSIPFPEWAQRWSTALSDLDELASLVRTGRRDQVRGRVLDALADGGDAGGGTADDDTTKTEPTPTEGPTG